MRIILNLLVILILVSLSCSKKDMPGESRAVNDKKKPFVPTINGSITVAQMQRWMNCNSILDSLSYLYADSFKTNVPENRTSYQTNFIKAQNELCAGQGLTGGYSEYLWILKNSGKDINKSVLDSLK